MIAGVSCFPFPTGCSLIACLLGCMYAAHARSIRGQDDLQQQHQAAASSSKQQQAAAHSAQPFAQPSRASGRECSFSSENQNHRTGAKAAIEKNTRVTSRGGKGFSCALCSAVRPAWRAARAKRKRQKQPCQVLALAVHGDGNHLPIPLYL